MKKLKRLAALLAAAVMAGSLMALTACGKDDDTNNTTNNNTNNNTNTPGGSSVDETAWKKMISDTAALKNFTVTEKQFYSYAVTKNGELLPVTDPAYEMYLVMTGDDADEFSENPTVSSEAHTYKFDLNNGVVGKFETDEGATASPADDKVIEEYSVAKDKSVTVYDYNKYMQDPETFEDVEGYHTYTYEGYASADDAKQALGAVETSVFMDYLTSEIYKGTGTNASVAGTLPEISQLFTYDSSTSTYKAEIIYEDFDDEEPVNLIITSDNGHVKYAEISNTMSQDLVDPSNLQYIPESVPMPDGSTKTKAEVVEMFSGLKMEITQGYSYEVSAVGSTSVSLPSDIDAKVKAEDTNKVMSAKTDWDALFDDLNSNSIQFSYSVNPDPVDNNDGTYTSKSISYSYEVSADKKQAMVNVSTRIEVRDKTTHNYASDPTYEYTYEYYRMNGSNAEKFTREGNSPEDLWTKSSEALTGDVLAQLPKAVQKYYNGFKAAGATAASSVKDMFDKKYFSDYKEYSVDLDDDLFNRVEVWYSYNSYEDKYNSLNLWFYYKNGGGSMHVTSGLTFESPIITSDYVGEYKVNKAVLEDVIYNLGDELAPDFNLTADTVNFEFKADGTYTLTLSDKLSVEGGPFSGDWSVSYSGINFEGGQGSYGYIIYLTDLDPYGTFDETEKGYGEVCIDVEGTRFFLTRVAA